MEDLEFDEWLQDASGLELRSLVESLFSLEFLKCDAVRDAIISLEQDEELKRIESLSDEDVFTKYVGFNEMFGTPVNISEYLAEKRKWEYECPKDYFFEDYWQKYDDAVTEHALSLLEEYEMRHKLKEQD